MPARMDLGSGLLGPMKDPLEKLPKIQRGIELSPRRASLRGKKII